jgi:putative ABC transport system permease protein
MLRTYLRGLARLYPPSFRKHYGAEIDALCDAIVSDSRSGSPWLSTTRVVLGVTIDTLRSAAVEWGNVLAQWWNGRAKQALARGPGDIMRSAIQDARFAVRVLAKRPGFTAAAAVTLALGIGANTAIFSVVNSILLNPLPIADAGRVVTICETNPAVAGFCIASPPNVEDWSEQSSSFESIGLARSWPFILKTADGVAGKNAGLATPGFFQVLRYRPLLGRLLQPEDLIEGNNHVIILSHAMWQSEYGADPEIIGRRITLDDEPYEIVGVLSAEAQPPQMEWYDFWAPLHFNPRNESRRSWRGFRPLARLAPGVTLESARSEMTTIASRLASQYPETNEGWGIRIIPLHEYVVGSARPMLLTFLGAVGFVLLIGCANVANLLLARTAGRQRELAVRTALGAGRSRLLQLLLGESLALSFLGGALGVALAWGAVDAFVATAPGSIPRLDQVSVDARALAFALLVSVVTSILFGLAPSLQATRLNVGEALKEGERKQTGRSNLRLRNALIVSEVALALMLLVGAGLFIQSFATLLKWQPGFDRDNLLTVWLLASSGKYSTGDEVVGLFERAAEDVEALPSVTSVGATSAGPLFGGREPGEFVLDGMDAAEDEPRIARWYDIDPEYLQTLGIPLLAGRYFDANDTRDTPNVAIVNETLASRFWPGLDPLGRSLSYEGRSMTVVGVVGDVQPFLHGTPVDPEVFWPKRQYPRGATFLVIRTAVDPLTLVPTIRDRLTTLDPDMQVSGFATLDQSAGRQLVRPRFNMLLVGSFAAVAIALAGIGIYGVVSYSVAQRTQEIGIRIALGARHGNVIGWIVVTGMKPIALGIAVGLGGAFAVTRLIASLLYGVQPRDPVTFIATAMFVTVVALLACYVPALRATKVDAVEALRRE